jgi:hypothetical protein
VNAVDADFFTDRTVFLDAIASAIKTWEEPFHLPVSGLDNYNPRGVQCRALFSLYGEAWYKRFLNPDKCSPCDIFLNNPFGTYASCAPTGSKRVLPDGFIASLQADVAKVERNVIGRSEARCSYNMMSEPNIEPLKPLFYHVISQMWFSKLMWMSIAAVCVILLIRVGKCKCFRRIFFNDNSTSSKGAQKSQRRPPLPMKSALKMKVACFTEHG